MNFKRSLLLLLPLLCLCLWLTPQAGPVVYPYLQNLTEDSAELYWVSTDKTPTEVTWGNERTISQARPAPELAYHPVEQQDFPELKDAPEKFLHHVRLSGLPPGLEVSYTVHFPGSAYENSFRTLPSEQSAVRLIAFADSETEPESTGKPAKWGTDKDPGRRYLIDQTDGFQAHLNAVRERRPNALLIAGDLVESGGEQRDWDEFWKQTGQLAGSIPFLPCPGNHEYYAGPKHGTYSDEGSQWAINKYRTYFHPKGSEKAAHYYSKELGPAVLLSLDSGNGSPHGGHADTNHHLRGDGFTVDFHEGSAQYMWLEAQLEKAQESGKFVIVMFHHCPYSSGGHGHPPGPKSHETDPQSGQPLRELTPLFMRYGVDLVLSGHDEMFERSEVKGLQTLPDGKKSPHAIQFYDVGVAGDGLRYPDRVNEWSKFLAYRDSQEIWKDNVLVEGGRHYGHLEIDVQPTPRGWTAELRPVYILPQETANGWKFERKLYSDVVKLSSEE